MNEALQHPDSRSPGLEWLVRLRWLAAGGQIASCVIAATALRIALPWAVLAACIGVTLLTNLFLESRKTIARWKSRPVPAGTLALDTITLTVMLYWTGGAHNPFTAFYLLHITIAAILLPLGWALGGVALCGAGYGTLFLSPHELVSQTGETCCGDMTAHLQGMLLAMILTGMFITFFVSRLNAALLQKESELHAARLAAEQHERFVSLATLAAGVAHEMATPLGTIAIASNDLICQARDYCGSPGCMSDARLIRAEVDRCRSILDKLNGEAWEASTEQSVTIRLGDLPKMLEDHLAGEHLPRVAFEIANAAETTRAPELPLLQALTVLIKNGIEAGGGALPVRVSMRRIGNGIEFVVIDQGLGMTDEVARRAGEPFFTTKEPGQGMGLGLFLVRTFAERVQGKLSIDSGPDRGTTASLFIPDLEVGTT